MPKSDASTTPDDEAFRRRKRRNLGAFPCLKCAKVFSRSDHLARHYLNHQPKEVYTCEFYVINHNGTRHTCGKTFVRKDLRDRHLRRHILEASGEPKEHLIRADNVPSPLDISNLIEMKKEPLVDPSETSEAEIDSALVKPPHSVIPAPNFGQNNPKVVADPLSGNSSVDLKNGHGLQLSEQGHTFPETSAALLESHQGVLRFDPVSTARGNAGMNQHNSLSNPGQASSLEPHHVSNPQQQQQFMPIPSYHVQSLLIPGHHLNPHISTSLAHEQVYQQAPEYLYSRPQFHQDTPLIRQNETLETTPQMPHGPDNSKGTDMLLGGQNFVQSQSDIISWLFMESPQDMNMNHSLSQPESGLSTLMEPPHLALMNHPHNLRQDFQQPAGFSGIDTGREETVPWYLPLYPGRSTAADTMLNVGLQDLNYFLKNENPLDEVFLRLQSGQTGNSPSDKKFRHINTISTNSSSSPTNTSDTATPHYFSDIYVNGIDRGEVRDRLKFHLVKYNIEKNKHFFVSKVLWLRIMSALPELTPNALLTIFVEDEEHTIEHRISFYLYAYWETFHRRFSILHKPSFSTATAEPLLLLSMLLIGSMYCATTPVHAGTRIASPEYKFCMLVAVPLRFKLFQHPGFKCPVAVWILQSLNLLEWCEKNYLSRDMHERGHVHHGTTVQLLRRSPFLGGNPTVKNKPNNLATDTSASGSEDDHVESMDTESDDYAANDESLFRDWVESESMKRVTFMTFYLDTIDYIKFRHNPQIPFFQLQLLNLPCDEESLWESNEINGSFRKLVKRQRKLQSSASQGSRNVKDLHKLKPGINFLTALKRLMKPQNARQRYSPFTRSILFGGIVSIMHQMQQTELQNRFTVISSGSEKNRNYLWKELLVKALDAYESDLHFATGNISSDPFFKIEEHQCKFPMYHLVLIIGLSDINHYDIAIFCGSPRNMSVEVSSKDVNIVKRKLQTIWDTKGAINSFNDLLNVRAVIHCYWLLWSLMIPPLNDDGTANESQRLYAWDADHDCFDTMYAVSIATLVLWCYTFLVCGLESSVFKDLESSFTLEDEKNYDKLSSFIKEDAYNFLFRVRDEFTKHFKGPELGLDFCIHKTGTNRRHVTQFDAIKKHCETLPKILGKENISGLCFLVGTKLYRSQWAIIRENARLIIHCGLRSLGKSDWRCPNVFESDVSSQ